MKPCKTIGCHTPTKDHAYCSACRFMRKRAKAEGMDPDARTWKQLDQMFWNRMEKAA